ncbi:GroES-like protein [Aureobasidium pullulans]|uniref:GroES-like protein n=1 Tax=Aureobasidium pullulans TaxID=5580 RepID=A0A4V4KL49_AURPU|nr:GroES-like protein [Aureobasidium pullulans]
MAPSATRTSSESALSSTIKSQNVGVFTNPEHELYIKNGPVPAPGPGECLIHVRATGICGSDIHFWKSGHIGDMIVVGENRLGHESAGVVVAVGEGVNRFKLGDRVALECGIPCMEATCYYCRTGKYNACPDVVFFSTPPYHGTLARYHVHPQEWLHKLPDTLSFEEGSLLEPLSVALAGIDRSMLRLGDPIVICGAGPIGLVTLLATHAANRLATAKKLIPRVNTVKIVVGETPKDSAARIKEALGFEAKIVFECTGVESSVQSAIYSCTFGGLVFVIGCGKDFQIHAILIHYRYKDTYPKAIGLVAAGLLDLKPLVTHRYTLEQGEDAFKTASDPKAKAIKVQILDE